jgi:L-ribulose-5-phosphate 3-epimerase
VSIVPGLSLGIYEKALPLGVGWSERLAMAASVGFDFVEMSVDSTEQRLSRLDWSAARRREIRHIMESADVPILTMCLSAHRCYPLGSSSPPVRDRALYIMREAIRLAADLGIRMIQVAGYDAYNEPSDKASQQRYVDGLRQAAIWASERAVLLGLENQEIGYVTSPTTALEVIREINTPYFQLYMDIGNLIVNGCDVLSEIAAAKGHLVGVHVKDARPGVPRRVPLGEGDVPFDQAFRQLAAIGFHGPVMIEMWNDDRPDSLDICAEAQKWVEQRLAAAWLPGENTPTSSEVG